MKTCNADATTKALKGDERKKFMSECLSDKAAAAPASDEKKAHAAAGEDEVLQR